jgi:AraC-like DNA-binding protein
MKKLLFILTLSFFSFHQLQAQTTKKELKHVVLFTFKASSSKAAVDSVVKAFNHLYGTVPQVKNMEWGLNMSPEHLDQGFTHCFSLTFSNEKDLADYQLHPAHKAFQTILKPHMDKVFVVDYFVGAR